MQPFIILGCLILVQIVLIIFKRKKKITWKNWIIWIPTYLVIVEIIIMILIALIFKAVFG